MRGFSLWLLVLLALLATPPLAASEPGQELSISLLTMGPGKHPFTKFGHSAIWVHDALTQRDEVYNYGTFAFDSPTLVLDSVEGKLPYWLSVQSMSSTLRMYRAQGRSLLASELELTPAELVQLHAALRENARPEQRYYRYDYYRDNCSTRVRDIVDRVIGGRMRGMPSEPASLSYRAHTQRLVADDRLLYAGLDLAVGRETDAPVTTWDEAWLPDRLHALFARATVTRAGQTLPLIRSERFLLTSRFPAPLVTPPTWAGYYAALGLALGVSFSVLGFFASSGRRVLRMVLGASYIALGSTLGLLGCALCYLTFCSAHSAAASNYNVLLLPPWLLLLSPAGVGVLRGKPWALPLARWAALGASMTSALALAIHALSENPQANLQEIAVALPLWLGVALSSWQARSATNTEKPLTLPQLRESGVQRS
ncbi:MAG TPA: DUF4105 domain-containing protein [Polyangiaceae bacterium]|nr:DUF4105 domain-containing protein [Polyangiaceae bacterium]